jgi:acyl-CoA reductase-like NAD-dependent aldehyde dehydrogenase
MAATEESAPSSSLTMTEILDAQRKAFLANSYPSAAERLRNLDKLAQALIAKKDQFVKSLNDDFGCRNRQETLLTDIFMVTAAIKHAKRELKGWMKPRKRDVPIVLGTGRAYVLPQPVGVVGIVSPWNFPLNLSLCPLTAALAAGNRAMIKPSEFTPATSELLKQMITEIFATDHVAVITGDASVGKSFVHLPFDHLLFTGSTEVGKYVMKAAADNLTPVTLELGGKSPAIVAPDADVNEAAIDIAFGKVLNAGQICIAPDYALVPRAKMTPFLNALKKSVDGYIPAESIAKDGYTSVVNERHHKRLSAYIDEARQKNVQIIPLAAEITAEGGNKLSPVAIVDPPEDLAIMKEEIFGPILLVKPYDELDEAIKYINARPRPLALYLFAKSKSLIESILKRTISGGVSVNDVIMHNVVEDLPFGGVGASGIGHYHGREGFDTFSKLRPVFERTGPRTDRFLRHPFKQLHEFLLGILINY